MGIYCAAKKVCPYLKTFASKIYKRCISPELSTDICFSEHTVDHSWPWVHLWPWPPASSLIGRDDNGLDWRWWHRETGQMAFGPLTLCFITSPPDSFLQRFPNELYSGCSKRSAWFVWLILPGAPPAWGHGWWERACDEGKLIWRFFCGNRLRL